MNEIVRIHNATVLRDNVIVFDRLSLTLDPGVHTVILGPNGAGKTTLLKLITRELYPQSRDGACVSIFGQQEWSIWDLRARLGLVSHDLQSHYVGEATGLGVVLSGFYSSLTVWEHQHYSPEKFSRADQLMEWLDISPLRDRRFRHLSTGEQRRLLLARALVHNPEVLILDEPTSGLDLKSCFAYLDRVRELMRRGTTIILVTHHIHEIAPEISRALLLKGGKVVGDGRKEDLITAPRLSALFDTPVRVVRDNGWYQVLPGA